MRELAGVVLVIFLVVVGVPILLGVFMTRTVELDKSMQDCTDQATQQAEQLQAYQADNTSLQAENARLAAGNTDLRQQLEQVESDFEAAQGRIAELESQVSGLTRERNYWQVLSSLLEEKLQELSRLVAEQSQAISRLEAERDRLANQLGAYEEAEVTVKAVALWLGLEQQEQIALGSIALGTGLFPLLGWGLYWRAVRGRGPQTIRER